MNFSLKFKKVGKSGANTCLIDKRKKEMATSNETHLSTGSIIPVFKREEVRGEGEGEGKEFRFQKRD